MSFDDNEITPRHVIRHITIWSHKNLLSDGGDNTAGPVILHPPENSTDFFLLRVHTSDDGLKKVWLVYFQRYPPLSETAAQIDEMRSLCRRPLPAGVETPAKAAAATSCSRLPKTPDFGVHVVANELSLLSEIRRHISEFGDGRTGSERSRVFDVIDHGTPCNNMWLY